MSEPWQENEAERVAKGQCMQAVMHHDMRAMGVSVSQHVAVSFHLRTTGAVAIAVGSGSSSSRRDDLLVRLHLSSSMGTLDFQLDRAEAPLGLDLHEALHKQTMALFTSLSQRLDRCFESLVGLHNAYREQCMRQANQMKRKS
jgi:hypothetical protein